MRYFLKGDCNCQEPTEHEVSLADYIMAEEAAGLRSKHSPPDQVSEPIFRYDGVEGRTMVDSPEEAVNLLVGALTSRCVPEVYGDWKAALQVLGVEEEAIETAETRYWNT